MVVRIVVRVGEVGGEREGLRVEGGGVLRCCWCDGFGVQGGVVFMCCYWACGVL